MHDAKFYTVSEAAKRVRRSRRTIERWITNGMQVIEVTTGNKTTRRIEKTELLKYLRQHLLNNPSRATRDQ